MLYSSPRSASVKIEAEPTTLFRVDEKTFRFMMQSQTQKTEEERKKLLTNIPFLSSLDAADIARLCSVMQPVLFSTGDYIVKKGESGKSFYILQEGRVRVTEIFVGGTSYEDIDLNQGDYFGEDSLVSDEPRAANVVALTSGTAFSIDREMVKKILGDFGSLISKAQDRQRLVSSFWEIIDMIASSCRPYYHNFLQTIILHFSITGIDEDSAGWRFGIF